MKVAYIVGEFPSISETFILREILALETKGVQVEIFSLNRPSSSKIHPDAKPLVERVHYRRSALASDVWLNQFRVFFRRPWQYAIFKWKAIFGNILNPVAAVKTMSRLFAAADFACRAGNPGITHVHAHFAFVTADIGFMMAKLFGTSFSFSAHARDIYTQPDRILQKKVRTGDFVVTCTEDGRNHLRRLCPSEPEGKIVMIRHGIRPDSFVPAGTPGSLVLAVGRLEEKKGFRHLAEACGILKKRGVVCRCTIAGDGPMKHSLSSQIAALGLANSVTLAGELAQDEIMKLYPGAAMLVVPSVVAADGDRDGLPNVIVEAMAMKLPVVASSVSAIPELVKNGVNGLLVPPGDPDALADGIQKLLADRSLGERMGTTGRETVCREFDISKNIEKLVELLVR